MAIVVSLSLYICVMNNIMYNPVNNVADLPEWFTLRGHLKTRRHL